jgi:hypothetical protein
VKKNICANYTQREEMLRTPVMTISKRGNMTKIPPLYYLFNDTTSPINAFLQASRLFAFHRNLGNVLEIHPHKSFAYAAVSASLHEADHGSLTDRWLPGASPVATTPPTCSYYYRTSGERCFLFSSLSLELLCLGPALPWEF